MRRIFGAFSIVVAWTAVCTASVLISKAVVIQRPHQRWRAEIAAQVPAPWTSAWSTLTDFNHQAAFIPNIASSRMIRTSAGPRVEQVGVIRFLGFQIHRGALFDVREDPAAGTIDLHAVQGDFKQFDQHWTVHRYARGVRLSYRAEVVPKGRLPQWIVKNRIRRSMNVSFGALAAEMLRRR